VTIENALNGGGNSTERLSGQKQNEARRYVEARIIRSFRARTYFTGLGPVVGSISRMGATDQKQLAGDRASSGGLRQTQKRSGVTGRRADASLDQVVSLVVTFCTIALIFDKATKRQRKFEIRNLTRCLRFEVSFSGGILPFLLFRDSD
jgi:hypothetical protein